MPTRRLSRHDFVTLYQYDPTEGTRSAQRTAAERAVSAWATAPMGESVPLALVAEQAILAGGPAYWAKQMGHVLARIRAALPRAVEAARSDLDLRVAMAENLFHIPKVTLDAAKTSIEPLLQNYLALASRGASDPVVSRAVQVLQLIDAAMPTASSRKNPRRRRLTRRRR